MLHDPIHNAIIRIYTFMVTLQSLPPLIPRDPERNAVFLAQFLQLRHDAVGDDGDAFGVEAVHHGGEQLELVLDGVREEVGVY